MVIQSDRQFDANHAEN